jgi:hypothetical protein
VLATIALDAPVQRLAGPLPAAVSAVVLLRPDVESVQGLSKRLRLADAELAEFHVVFAGSPVDDGLVAALASADRFERVKSVAAVSLDFVACAPHLFLLPPVPATPAGHRLHSLLGEIGVSGRPVVRWSAGFPRAEAVACEFAESLSRSAVVAGHGPLVLVMDRDSDPVSALLHGWDYLSVIYEHCQVKRCVASVDGVSVPLAFANSTMASVASKSWGDALETISELSAELSRSKQEVAEMRQRAGKELTFKDISRALQIAQDSAASEKLVSAYAHCARVAVAEMEREGTLERSALEQRLAVSRNGDAAWKTALELLDSPGCSQDDMLRTALLAVLACDDTALVGRLAARLHASGVSAAYDVLTGIIASGIGHTAARGKSGLKKLARRLEHAVLDPKDDLHQHRPFVTALSSDAIANNLDPALFPSASGAPGERTNGLLVIYVVGQSLEILSRFTVAAHTH